MSGSLVSVYLKLAEIQWYNALRRTTSTIHSDMQTTGMTIACERSCHSDKPLEIPSSVNCKSQACQHVDDFRGIWRYLVVQVIFPTVIGLVSVSTSASDSALECWAISSLLGLLPGNQR
ncbi:hypothetical protein PAXRUDRAFT_224666 [Paxillus rubicundulus Ve08.2h10]|uniref:Uncharacterized protein n=1 Tax=Paxillus rubicundulus Ve08.2h10 TaxID=930991 RepID=A0A0D0EBD6_9AGAM|nr:hypothetical protein PAXRUDRAFT_224666 [Paxillus rubicundulus Ve08.2h10]